jgi:hypothetical protein
MYMVAKPRYVVDAVDVPPLPLMLWVIEPGQISTGRFVE